MSVQANCLIANFGDKDPTNPVDGGHYPVPSCFADTQAVSPGDLLLLVCWGGHKGLSGDAWGLGTVTNKVEEEGGLVIQYRYIAFGSPIGRTATTNGLAPLEAKRFTVPHCKANWLIGIAPSSFQRIVR